MSTLNLISTGEAVRVAAGVDKPITKRAVIDACKAGKIAGAFQISGRWAIPKTAFLKWLNSPRKRGPKPGRPKG